MAIGVIGGNIDLPPEFPEHYRDNAGNMAHANAPFGMFKDCHHATKTPDFVNFVNQCCSHLIVTLANILRPGEGAHQRHAPMAEVLARIKKPIVVFGLGAQAKDETALAGGLPEESVAFLKMLSERSAAIGVRGAFTLRVLEECAGITNGFVTGCPSLFSQPDLVRTLRKRETAPGARPAYAATHLHLPLERRMLARAVADDSYYIEPFHRMIHLLHEELQSGDIPQKWFPYTLRAMMRECGIGLDAATGYFRDNYRLFRHLDPWVRFCQRHVRFTCGTRFHVNMASLLAGRPALWLTHDSRTTELTEYFQLPRLPLAEAAEMPLAEIEEAIDLEPFFDNFGAVSQQFNEFLGATGLPRIGFQT